jgi:hypothetical protein
VYNSLNYRNLSVRSSGSGEAGSIRLNDHNGNRVGLNEHLRRHSGKFGHDSVQGSLTSNGYVTVPSIHKIHRNTSRRPAKSTTLLTSPIFKEVKDNAFVTRTIPQSDFQYTWLTSSLGGSGSTDANGGIGCYAVNSGKQRIYGYAPRDGILSSSVVINGESGFVPAINFPTASEIFGE